LARGNFTLQEDVMQKLTPLFTVATVCALSASLAGRAAAGALVGAEGVRAALDGMSVVEKVVCTPGVVHASTWPFDGCPRGVYWGRDDGPATAAGTRPHFYGWGPSGYRLGVGPAGYVGPGQTWGWVGLGYDWGHGYGWSWGQY
jgi:hypothetical protein